jgi:phytoene dehydrogenase-like protein
MRRVDMVVVGAGLAGLSAARPLAGKADVLVLEARDRVGGRTVGHTFPNGYSVKMGRQWVEMPTPSCCSSSASSGSRHPLVDMSVTIGR